MCTVGSVCEVHVRLEGLVDAAKEIARLEESIAKCSSQRDKLLQTTKVDGYEEKVCFFGTCDYRVNFWQNNF